MTNRTNLTMILGALRRGIADFAYGIDAGNAIRHGLPVPPRRGSRDGRVLPATSSSSTPAASPASTGLGVACAGCGAR